MERILLVDDDTTLALMLRTWLEKKGFRAESVPSVEAARRALAAEPYDLVLTDMRLPDRDGICLLQWLAGQGRTTPVIVMTGYAEIQNAVQCMKLGARDYIAKPVRPDELLLKIREALKAPAPAAGDSSAEASREAAAQDPAAAVPDYLEGRSDASRKLYEYVRLVAPTNMSVLICGASGTGKEHIARLIHARSRRSDRPFVAIDCGTIPGELAASEFFGHVKGSFTGAASDKTGAFEAADGGTLFLDEAGNLSYETQIRLLRALQERRIKPVGSNRDIPIDIRIIAATNENLGDAILRKTFRADLYHRLAEFTLRMPELREMPADIPLFADFFLDRANRELGRQIVGFDTAAAALLKTYDWPGNLRQLRHAVMYATLLCEGEYITCRELPAEIVAGPGLPEAAGAFAAETGGPEGFGGGGFRMPGAFGTDTPLTPLRDPAVEEERIRRALLVAGGNRSQAAKMLGIDRKTLYNKMRAYGIE